MKLPLYQGETLQPSRTPKGAAPAENPFSSSFMQAAAIAANKLRSIEEAIQDRQEFTLEQNRSAQAAEATNQLNNQLINDLSLPDGHPDSPYDSDGILRPEYADNLKAQYSSIADSWGKGFTSEQGMQNAYKAAQQWRQGVNETVDSKIRAASKGRADRAISNNIKTCLAYRDYDGASIANLNAHKRGYKTEAEYLYDQNQIDLDRAGFQIDSCRSANEVSAWLNNPANKGILYRNPKLHDKATARKNTFLRNQATQAKSETELEIARMQLEALALEQHKNQYEANPQYEETIKHVASLKPAKANARFEDTLPAAPQNASANIRLLFLKTRGDFSSPEAKQQAYAALLTEAAAIDPKNTEAVFGLNVLAENIGLDAANAKAAIEYYHPKDTSEPIKFNPVKVAADIKALTRANSEKNLKLMQSFLGTDVEALTSRLPKLEVQQAMVDYASLLALHEYQAWAVKEENRNASTDTQANKFNSIYQQKLKEQRYYDETFYNTSIAPIIQQYIKNGAEEEITKHLSEKEQKEAKEKLKALNESFNKEIDNFIKKKDIDQALAKYPLQAAEMRFVLQSALERQKDLSFSVDTDTSGISAHIDGTQNFYVLYIPKSDTPLTKLEHIIAKVPDSNPLAIRVVQVAGLKQPVVSEKLQDRFYQSESGFNHITFENDMLSFNKVERKEVKYEKAHPEEAAHARNLNTKIKAAKITKSTSSPSDDDYQEEDPDSVPLIQAESSLLPDDGLVPESHFMPTGDLPL